MDQELTRWTYFAGKIPDLNLRKQALASIRTKRFHALGGAVYSLYPGAGRQAENLLKFIVAFQTISDYLDNLCDRAGVEDETSFRQLHLAMLDAVNPENDLKDYYCYYPYQNDLGYLELLVTECRTQIQKMPGNGLILKYLERRVWLYNDLQALKHLNIRIRESRLSAWAKTFQDIYPQLSWWEFSAASGSTLEIFLLVATASEKSLTSEEITRIDQAYFPYIQGLHILLDYYIDAQEDQRMGDLNFVQYYDSYEQCQTRLEYFIAESLKSCASLRYSKYHRTIIQGLLAMYLSDPKALTIANRPITAALLKKGGAGVYFYHSCCRLLRMLDKI